MLDVTVEHLTSARSCPREEVCRDGVTEMRAHRCRMRLEFSWAEGGSGAGEKPLLRDAAAVGAAGLVTGNCWGVMAGRGPWVESWPSLRGRADVEALDRL